jgi:hypothetical protein
MQQIVMSEIIVARDKAEKIGMAEVENAATTEFGCRCAVEPREPDFNRKSDIKVGCMRIK